MVVIKYLLILLLLTVVSGQLLRLPFAQTAALTLTDIVAIFTGVLFIAMSLTLKRSLKLNAALVVPTAIFSLYVISVNIFALVRLPFYEVLVSSLFLLRFLALFFVSVIVSNTVEKSRVPNWVNMVISVGLVFSLFGFLQLIFFPDLSFLTVYGWDPHQMRIASTFLDPNYSGLAYIFFFVLAVSNLLFNVPGKKMESQAVMSARKYRSYFYLLSSMVFFVSIIFTFSRSTYLAFIAAIVVIGLLKSPRLLLLLLTLLLVLFFVIPQMRTRIYGALSFDDTSRARVESWEQGFDVFFKNPLFGIGFNTYRYSQLQEKPTGSQDFSGHSGSGVDSSLLLVAATTGAFGFILFCSIIFLLFVVCRKKASKRPIALSGLAFLVSLLVHSQFVNSMFFPQLMLLFWFTMGLVSANDS